MPGFRQVLSLVVVLALLLVQAVTGEAATTKKKPAEKAPDSPAMAFAIVRSGTVGCEPNCPQWISAEGQIMPGSANQFRKILKQAGKLRLPVVITSPGGDVEAALAIGQMIRERKLDVLVGWTLFTGCNPTVKTCKLPKAQKGVYAGLVMTSRGYCLSACPFIFAAGQKRILGAGAFLGVHEITTQPITQRIRYNEIYRIVNGKKKVLSRKVVSRKNIVGKATTKMSKPFDRKLKAYLNTMGVSLAMLDLLHLAPPSSIHTLTTEEMKSTNLVTASGTAAELVSNSLCKAATPADNCKVEKNFVVATLAPPAPPQAKIQPVYSPASSPMAFVLVRSDSPGCEPLCPEWIFAEGIITPATPGIFEWFLEKTKSQTLPIVIRSDGGHARAAMVLGRSIRKHGMQVAVGAISFAGCSTARFFCRSPVDQFGRHHGTITETYNYCNSSCILVLAAGQRRFVGSTNEIQVRKLAAEEMPAIPNALKISTKADQEKAFQSDLGKYLNEMGIDRKLMKYIGDKSTGIHAMEIKELVAVKLATNHSHGSSFMNNMACKSSPPTDNCIKR